MRKRCIRSCMILLLVFFSFSRVYAQYAPPVSSFHATLVLEDERLTRDKNYFLIWKMYARALSHTFSRLKNNFYLELIVHLPILKWREKRRQEGHTAHTL